MMIGNDLFVFSSSQFMFQLKCECILLLVEFTNSPESCAESSALPLSNNNYNKKIHIHITVISLQEANDSSHDWYKKMYNTIHKVSDGGE